MYRIASNLRAKYKEGLLLALDPSDIRSKLNDEHTNIYCSNLETSLYNLFVEYIFNEYQIFIEQLVDESERDLFLKKILDLIDVTRSDIVIEELWEIDKNKKYPDWNIRMIYRTYCCLSMHRYDLITNAELDFFLSFLLTMELVKVNPLYQDEISALQKYLNSSSNVIASEEDIGLVARSDYFIHKFNADSNCYVPRKFNSFVDFFHKRKSGIIEAIANVYNILKDTGRTSSVTSIIDRVLILEYIIFPGKVSQDLIDRATKLTPAEFFPFINFASLDNISCPKTNDIPRSILKTVLPSNDESKPNSKVRFSNINQIVQIPSFYLN